jgi:16S rRNA U516 pseudouridylate synthase RsuA-like enzyme
MMKYALMVNSPWKNEKPIYLAYKPVGIECTTNLDVRNNIIDYINYETYFPNWKTR